MMNRKILCCDECFEMIARRSTIAARIWLDLCVLQDSCQLIGLSCPDNDILYILETMNFINSTEANEMILLKVLGREEGVRASFFCGGECEQEMQ